ncbi:L-rhamnose mutarotase [Gilvimarinus agarilyticus]|uniref:L-rhamnose mutarotase n=1 Tax=unclassified Gilvimarinus TaxID=2642066 RepID=UPI001C099FF2|nr:MULTISPECIES: L-rhamnose mutarotase [unclassified Gilvimarinus]MBU2885633.1 L-rhamnose mutarotase [Gilvimarinus agarilyticus]MDO6570495.1 L-rhamnose mutarotase [Gilvimarinus sp. 2_MG-2023]MDO6748597.1 L-rhamnose mutarotase [Gilvimarinus sp. 1_MG-2023]
MTAEYASNGVRRYCLALDLKDDPALIERYREFHQPENVWPEVKQSIKDSGILDMKIYLLGNRLVMVMEVDNEFSFAAKAAADQSNAKVREWEQLMDTFQQAVPWAKAGEKWVPMEPIFSL